MSSGRFPGDSPEGSGNGGSASPSSFPGPDFPGGISKQDVFIEGESPEPAKGAHRESDPRSGSGGIEQQALEHEYRHGALGLIIGWACILLGALLCIFGVVGSTSWTAKLAGIETKLNDAAPGVVLFVIGLLVIYITKPKVHIKRN